MITLHYIGDHAKDTWLVRFGWWLTRRVQSGEFKRVTHMECVHAGTNYKLCTIASSSARDGGVRVKPDVALTKGNWLALDVPNYQIEASKKWFTDFDDEPYNWIAAAGTKLPSLQWLGFALRGFFCNWACLAAFMRDAYKATPSQSCERLVRDCGAVGVTAEFFKD